VVAVLGMTGRNFAAGMSGGIAYVYDIDGKFESRCNTAMVRLERIDATLAPSVEEGAPRQRRASVWDNGIGDPLGFDAQRLRILVERHLLHTGSARARALLDNWNDTLARFVKVMPIDYAKALTDLKNEAVGARVAAE
jgi:glutamate synthase (NADPH/NADH) large chain